MPINPLVHPQKRYYHTPITLPPHLFLPCSPRRFFFMEAGDFAQLLCDRLLALLEGSEPLASSGSSIQGGRRALGAQALAMALDEARYGVGCMLGNVHGW